MGAFTLDISNPFPTGIDGGLGGPGQGGHRGADWFEAFGNDLGAPPGTPVHAVYDGKITKIDRTHIGSATGPVYGAGIFVRAATATLDPNAAGGVGCYYTHVTLAPGITEGALVPRGEVVGEVIGVPGIPPHLHFAIAERRGGTNFGIDIYQLLLATAGTTDVTTLTFTQDGSPPAGSLSGETPHEHEPLEEQER
jgi:murein DD-endopeptidase MepM/ murein hydrolase activator NlpD